MLLNYLSGMLQIISQNDGNYVFVDHIFKNFCPRNYENTLSFLVRMNVVQYLTLKLAIGLSLKAISKHASLRVNSHFFNE